MDREVAAWATARPSVEALGLIPAGQVRELAARARAVLAPSVWEEPFGLVVVEAMAAGTPAIAAAHGSFTELITPGVDGVLFEPGDPAALAQAVADVAVDPEKYETYGRRARDTYEQQFSPEHSLKYLLEIYSFAMTNPARAADSAEPAARPQVLKEDCSDAIGTAPPRGRLAGRPRGRPAVADYLGGPLRRSPHRAVDRLAGARPRNAQPHLRPGGPQPGSAVLVRGRDHRGRDRAGAGLDAGTGQGRGPDLRADHAAGGQPVPEHQRRPNPTGAAGSAGTRWSARPSRST